MPAYLIHGVPDSSRVWDAVRRHLARRDVVAPDLPGFGTPLPAAFGATADEYVDWLIADIARLGSPVDLVGHDWGGLFVQRIAALRPELVRTMATGSGPCDREYVWHDMAQAWQTPGMGEQIMQMFEPSTAAIGLTDAGMTPDYAAVAAARITPELKDSILKLYRSAIDIGARWEPSVQGIRCPVLVIWPLDDPYVTLRFGERLAERVHGRLLRVDGGHWWPLQRPEQVARALEQLWAG